MNAHRKTHPRARRTPAQTYRVAVCAVVRTDVRLTAGAVVRARPRSAIAVIFSTSSPCRRARWTQLYSIRLAVAPAEASEPDAAGPRSGTDMTFDPASEAASV